MPTYLLTLTAPERVATAIADELAEGTRVSADAAGAFDLGNGSWGMEAYFPDAVDPERLIDALSDAFAARADITAEDLIAAFAGFALRPFEADDWSDLALDKLPPIAAGRFRVFGEHNRPAVRDLRRNDLVIEASTAFGTGDHASTYLSLIALDAVLKCRTPRRVLDLGTGTGLLALAVAKVAPGVAVVASDIEPVAVAMTELNARGNAVGGNLRIALADGLRHPLVSAGAPYDLMLANILPGPLTRLSNDVIKAMSPGGVLIIAGLRQGEEARMISVYATRGLVFGARYRAKEWSSLVFVKP
jgi:ribosomal protein L11 methyltransferase